MEWLAAALFRFGLHLAFPQHAGFDAVPLTLKAETTRCIAMEVGIFNELIISTHEGNEKAGFMSDMMGMICTRENAIRDQPSQL